MATADDGNYDFASDEPERTQSETISSDGSRDPVSDEPEHVKYSRNCNCVKCVARRGGRADGGNTSDRRARPSQKGSKLDIDAFARQLQGAHVIAFTLLSGPLGPEVAQHILIDEKQAKELARTIGELLQHYSISIDPKTQAILAFVFTAGIIYLPKLGKIAQASRARAAQKPAQHTSPAPMPMSRVKQAVNETPANSEAPSKASGVVVHFDEYNP